jgi:hypothetical protein
MIISSYIKETLGFGKMDEDIFINDDATQHVSNSGDSICWLCDHYNHRDAVIVNKFIVESMPKMQFDIIVRQVYQYIARKFPNAGLCENGVREHIHQHLLIPQVKVAELLRDLISVSGELRVRVMTNDDTGNMVVDRHNMDLYLKVVSQIMQIYKAGDNSRMLFQEN